MSIDCSYAMLDARDKVVIKTDVVSALTEVNLEEVDIFKTPKYYSYHIWYETLMRDLLTGVVNVPSVCWALGLVGSSDLDQIQLAGQQLTVGWSRLALTPCGLSSWNKLTR